MTSPRPIRPGFLRASFLGALLLSTACTGGTTPPAPTDSHPLLGTFVFSAAGPEGPDNAAFQSAIHDFDLYTLPVYFLFVQPQEGQFDFTLPDAVADAAPPGTALYVPGLIWNDHLPDWLANSGYTGPELRALLVAYVTRVVEHYETKYPGRVIAYEPVLEPLSWHGPAGFWHKIGLDAGLDQYEYIRVAFATARAAAPKTQLYVDDFGAEDAGAKSDELFALVSGLLDSGVPLDGVGLEGHFMIGAGGAFSPPPPPAHVTATLDRYAALGLATMLTSVDIALPDGEVNAAVLQQQAEAYGDLVHACRNAGCAAFSTWGLGDADSWIPQSFPGWGAPLLFDAHYAPKPAFRAVRAALAD